VRLLILLQDLWKLLGCVTSIELTTKGGCLFVLKAVEEIYHKLVRVVLLYGVELTCDNVLYMLELNDRVVLAEGILVEEIESIAEVKVVLLGGNVFELGICLSQIVFPHLVYGSETLHEGIEVAVVAIVSETHNSLCEELALVCGPIHGILVLICRSSGCALTLGKVGAH
jgi:hypothetical protein